MFIMDFNPADVGSLAPIGVEILFVEGSQFFATRNKKIGMDSGEPVFKSF